MLFNPPLLFDREREISLWPCLRQLTRIGIPQKRDAY